MSHNVMSGISKLSTCIFNSYIRPSFTLHSTRLSSPPHCGIFLQQLNFGGILACTLVDILCVSWWIFCVYLGRYLVVYLGGYFCWYLESTPASLSVYLPNDPQANLIKDEEEDTFLSREVYQNCTTACFRK